MYSRCTNHTARMTCAQWLMFHLAPHSTLNTPAQVLSHLPLLCYCRPLLRTQTCPRIHLSTVKIHGGMVLLRNFTPPQEGRDKCPNVGLQDGARQRHEDPFGVFGYGVPMSMLVCVRGSIKDSETQELMFLLRDGNSGHHDVHVHKERGISPTRQ